jgi:transcription termination factor Rho
MTDSPERSLLESKSRDELAAIADAAGVKIPARARKAAMVDAILGETPGNGAGPSAAADGPAAAAAEVPSAEADSSTDAAKREPAAEPAGGPKVRRVRRAAGESDGEDTSSVATGSRPTDKGAADKGSRDKGSPDKGSPDKSSDDSRSDGGKASRDRDTGKGDSGKGESAKGDSGKGGAGPSNGNGNGKRQNADDDAAAEPGNRRRRRRGRDRDEQWQGDPVDCEGVLDLRDEGYGFLRTQGVLPSNDDVYVAAKQVRQFGLRRGDRVAGAARPATRNEKNPALLRIDSVNAAAPELAKDRPLFDRLTPLFPDERLRLERPEQPWDLTPRIIDLLAPIGKGQRGLIVSPPKAGKTSIMKEIAKSIEVNDPEAHLIVLLVDERPEEVTDMKRSIKGEVMASTFDRPVEEHIAVAELTLERAKRMVESGRDVVIILDGITRLARAYNLAAPGTGRMMSGGVDAGALYPPKKFFGTARNLEEGGSLTILATALVETGSRMDEVIFEEFKGTGNMELRLDRRLAERRVFPAIDVDASSTRREELLMDRKRVDQVWKLRKVLQGLSGDGDSGAGLELLVERISNFKTNDEFLDEIGKAKS